MTTTIHNCFSLGFLVKNLKLNFTWKLLLSNLSNVYANYRYIPILNSFHHSSHPLYDIFVLFLELNLNAWVKETGRPSNNAVYVVRKIPFSCCSEFSDFYTLASPNLELNISHAGSVEWKPPYCQCTPSFSVSSSSSSSIITTNTTTTSSSSSSSAIIAQWHGSLYLVWSLLLRISMQLSNVMCLWCKNFGEYVALDDEFCCCRGYLCNVLAILNFGFILNHNQVLINFLIENLLIILKPS